MRFVLMKQCDNDSFCYLMSLESHLSQREEKGGGLLDTLKAMASFISIAIKEVFQGQVIWTLGEIENAIGIQFTNSFEINSLVKDGRAMYPIISKINHSCTPNAAHSNDFDDDHRKINRPLQKKDHKVFMRLIAQRTIRPREKNCHQLHISI